MNSFNIKTGSQAKQRDIHKSLHGQNWIVEMAQFIHRKDAATFETIETPWVYVVDLKQRIFDRLDTLEKQVSC